MKDKDLFAEFETSNELKIDDENKKFKLDINFNDYKSVLYTGLFYMFGLFIGSYFYKITQFESLSRLIEPQNIGFISLFWQNLCIYFSIFVLVVFLGFCLIGFPVINTVPMLVGIFTGIRLAYFFINYGTKGVGYSLIMIIPFSALFITVIALTIEISTQLSKSILNCTKGEEQDADGVDIKVYTKKYLLFSLLILAVSAVNSAVASLLYSVVSL